MAGLIRIIVALVLIVMSTELSAQTLEKGTNNFGVGLNGGITIGDLEDSYSGNIGLDLFYLRGITDKISLGATTGFANYFGQDITVAGITTEIDDAQFIPLAASVRFSPIPKLMAGADIGYAIGINDGNDGGFYASPRLTYLFGGKYAAFAGYRLIGLEDDNLGAIQFGIGYKF